MESIDSLARAVNDFKGGMVLVSHDMRLISQMAKEIWICDHASVTRYEGDISNFKMELRASLALSGTQKKVGGIAVPRKGGATGSGLDDN